MKKFIAAMDHSGGSTGGVLERYGQEYTEENKMDLVHQMRQRMIANTDFNGENISHAILYKDTVERGIVPELKTKGIRAILKIDSGCEEDGTLKDSVFGTKDGEYSLAYNDLIAPLIKALQEADDKIEALEARITTLEG